MIREHLLTRRGLVFLSSTGRPPDAQVRALELELAGLGFVASSRLRARLASASEEELLAFHAAALAALAAQRGSDVKHEPLFRSFPAGIPEDTTKLWWEKALVHYLQCSQQPCIFCGECGTTHVLAPCTHVVCDRCFDGSNYSACPVCEHHVDRSSPFFTRSPYEPALPSERVVFTRLDVREDYLVEVRALFESLCARRQALSLDDRAILVAIATEHGTAIRAWVPETIPIRENVALLFGTLASAGASREILAVARPFLTTATDVLRIVSVLSGKDGSLLPEPGKKTARFRVAKLPRALRRDLLALLDSLPAQSLGEDMLRHDSLWVWIGEHLHPHEYAKRYPNIARAFQVVRKKAPDGTPSPPFETWNTRLEIAAAENPAAMLAALVERPGELARRLDWALRRSPEPGHVVTAFESLLPRFATPVLVGLRSHLPARLERASVRVFWPRVGNVTRLPDARPPLDAHAVAQLGTAIDAELLARFAERPFFEVAVIDAALRDVPVPFSERAGTRTAVTLPRGSKIEVPRSKLARLFMHWCEPETGEVDTDLDLSVGFYDAAWKPVGVCSFYELTCSVGAQVVARSAGDLRNAPFPGGATELVDIDRDTALAAGFRYAVMVVNNYHGLPFGSLARAFAGLMLRDDPAGVHFDPRTVELKFEIDGDNGIFLPLVFDLEASTLSWLDVQSKGALAMNTVESSKRAITSMCPDVLSYFASGTRPSMFDLAALHAAARCRRVFVRGAATAELVRGADETVTAFHARIVRGEADQLCSPPVLEGPALVVVLRGDLDVPDGSAAYALFRERVTPSLAASDLLS